MAVSIALTAAAHGAVLANHVEVVELLKKKGEGDKEVVCGAVVRDKLTGESWPIRAKGVINATGPFVGNVPFPLRCTIATYSSAQA